MRTYCPKLLPRMSNQKTGPSLPESEGQKENGIAPLTSHSACLRAEEIARVGSFLESCDVTSS